MNTDLEQQFFGAVRANDVERVRSLLEEDRSLANARILGDATLLDERVWENGVRVPVKDNETRDTPALHHAVFYGHIEMAKLLLDHGADLHAIAYENNHEQTPAIVIAAWEGGGIDMLRMLLERGADPNVQSSNGVTPLSTAMRHEMPDRVELLKQFGAKK